MVAKNQKGIATIETLPMLVIFVVLFSYGMGLFGVIHSGILYSISARAYAFETFRNRTNVTYFRSNNKTDPQHFANYGVRLHGILAENHNYKEGFIAGKRPIAFGRKIQDVGNDVESHNQKIHTLKTRNRRVAVNPVWLMIAYGICINPNCGD